jgi:hypothetical protein
MIDTQSHLLRPDPGAVEFAYPGGVVDAGGRPAPMEVFRSRPTGYLPNADGVPQRALIDAQRGIPGSVYEYSDGRFPPELLDASERIDQHPFMHVTATITVADDNPRKTGTRDPMDCGPARPDTVLLHLHEYRGAGFSNTKYSDVPDGRKFSPYGSQDGSTWVQYQDATAVISPLDLSQSPARDDPSQNRTAQPTQGRMAPGPSHGWTSVPLHNVKAADNLKSTRQLKQQKSPHQDRKANSTILGQTYSQRTSTVRQAGTAGPTPGADEMWW